MCDIDMFVHSNDAFVSLTSVSRKLLYIYTGMWNGMRVYITVYTTEMWSDRQMGVVEMLHELLYISFSFKGGGGGNLPPLGELFPLDI